MKFLKFLLKLLSFAPALAIMYMIFSFSAQDGTESSNLSYKVSYEAVTIVNETLDLGLTDKQFTRCINKIHHYVRKLAHFSEYFLLAVSLAVPLYVYGLRGIWLVIIVGTICAAFASSDEFHQIFVSGRGPSVKDICIDTCGSLVGIIFVRIFGYIGRKTIFARFSHENL